MEVDVDFDKHVKMAIGSSAVVTSSYEKLMSDQAHSVFLPNSLVEALQLSSDEIAWATARFKQSHPEYTNYHPACFANNTVADFSRMVSEVAQVNPEWARMLQEVKYPGCKGKTQKLE